MEQMCVGREFEVVGADTEKAHEVKLLVSYLWWWLIWPEDLCWKNVRIGMEYSGH